MFSSKPRFDPNKCKVQLKLLVNRINLLTSKRSNLAKAEKRKVAMMLRDDREHNARILVEQIIREDYHRRRDIQLKEEYKRNKEASGK